MEERHDEQRTRLESDFGFRGRRAPHRLGHAHHDDVLDVCYRLAMRDGRTFRLPGGARRVQNREDVVLIDRRFGHPRIVEVGGQLRERPNCGVGRAVESEDVLQGRQRCEPIAHECNAARVADEHLRFRVAEPELELLRLPPRVERHERRAEDGARPPRDHPLGHVRRHEGDPVAALHAQTRERTREYACEPVVLAVREASVFLHDPVDVGTRRVLSHQLAQGAHALFVDLHRMPGDVFDDDLEGAARAGELCDRIDRRHAYSFWTTSNASRSLPVLTGPRSLCWAWPLPNAWLFSQRSKSSVDRQRV